MHDSGQAEAGRVLARARRTYTPVTQPRQWVHHVLDLGTGQLQTTELTGPPTPAGRASRLTGIGGGPGTTVFGGRSFELTPLAPTADNQQAYLLAYALDYYDPAANVMAWSPPINYDASSGDPRDLHFQFPVAPGPRSVLTIELRGFSWSGRTGTLVVGSDSGGTPGVTVPISDVAAAHTIDVMFTEQYDESPEFIMVIGAGIRQMQFSGATFHVAPPENELVLGSN